MRAADILFHLIYTFIHWVLSGVLAHRKKTNNLNAWAEIVNDMFNSLMMGNGHWTSYSVIMYAYHKSTYVTVDSNKDRERFSDGNMRLKNSSL